MDNFTTNNYEMKREIINFSKKISDSSDKPESKFIMDMIFYENMTFWIIGK